MIESARYYKGLKYFYHYDHLHALPYVRVFEMMMKWYTKQKTGKKILTNICIQVNIANIKV